MQLVVVRASFFLGQRIESFLPSRDSLVPLQLFYSTFIVSAGPDDKKTLTREEEPEQYVSLLMF